MKAFYIAISSVAAFLLAVLWFFNGAPDWYLLPTSVLAVIAAILSSKATKKHIMVGSQDCLEDLARSLNRHYLVYGAPDNWEYFVEHGKNFHLLIYEGNVLSGRGLKVKELDVFIAAQKSAKNVIVRLDPAEYEDRPEVVDLIKRILALHKVSVMSTDQIISLLLKQYGK